MKPMTILFNKKSNTFILTHIQYEFLPKDFKDKCANFTFYGETEFRELLQKAKYDPDLTVIEVDSLLNRPMDADTTYIQKSKYANAKRACLLIFIISIVMIVIHWAYIYTTYGIAASVATGVVFSGCMIMFIMMCILTYLFYLDAEEVKIE